MMHARDERIYSRFVIYLFVHSAGRILLRYNDKRDESVIRATIELMLRIKIMGTESKYLFIDCLDFSNRQFAIHAKNFNQKLGILGMSQETD